MKAYTVNGSEIKAGLSVTKNPYPHIVMGEGGHKRATWIPIGRRDAENVIKWDETETCWDPHAGYEREPRTCEVCGKAWELADNGYYTHKNRGKVVRGGRVEDVGVIKLQEPKKGFLVVAPRPGKDNRVLVLWNVSSGYRGGSGITAGEGVTVIAEDSSWHSGRGSLGSTAQMLAILAPGQELYAARTGRRVQDTKAVLRWNGEKITVTFGDSSLEAAEADEVQGEYV